MAADIVNLNRTRKARVRAEKERQSAENRVRFGRTKSERAKQGADTRRAQRDMDGKKIENGDGG